MINGSTILVTGGTGSFGNKFVKMTLKKYKPKKIIIFSRDEMKQWEMQKNFAGYKQIRYFIGDVRDKDRLLRAFEGVDIVVHAAATKIVPTAEYNPFECVKTNIFGAMNVIDSALDRGVQKVVALSTDKASAPINIYGASKLASDKLFINSSAYSTKNKTKFCVVRYGNVMGSRGSVIPFFSKQRKTGTLPITDVRMTRFMITLEAGVELVWQAIEEMYGGEIFVKKIPSMNIVDIAKTIGPNCDLTEIGSRPGEKLHEQMIGPEDAPFCYEYPDYFKILPANETNAEARVLNDGGKLVDEDFRYSSESNSEWMSPEELSNWAKVNIDVV